MVSRGTVATARRLRAGMTLPEVLLWRELRGKAGGVRFRRQHPVGAYVLDFYCPAARVAVEIDGAAHAMGHGPARDAGRDAWLAGRGIRVVRVAAAEVLRAPGAVAEMVAGVCLGVLGE